MMKKVALGILTAFIFLVSGSVACIARDKKSEPFLEASVNRSKAIDGERLIYEVTLFSPDPEIVGIELMAEPDFGRFARRRSASDMRLSETERKGVRYYKLVIDRFFLGVDGNGKHTIKGGKYRIGYNRRVAMNDPFWGLGYANQVEMTELSAPDVPVAVSSLPEHGKPADFSGAIGNFEVVVSVPEGKIRAKEEACVVITLSGEGDLSRISPPDVMQAFGNGLQFKSMTENRSEYVSKGMLGSELEMECMFVPEKEGSYTIDGISFSYYNPVTRKYETARSRPVTIEVDSGKPSKGAPPLYMDI